MTDFAAYTADVAVLLVGERNARLSTRKELRIGKNGSFAVDLEKGTFYDHESKEGGGCIDLIKSFGHEPIEWLRQHGFAVDDDRPKPNGHHSPAKNGTGSGGGWNVVAEYDYRDEAGTLLYQAVRLDPKDFRQRQPDGKGGWKWTLKGARLVPYRLAEVLQAVADDSYVFIVEGEKDADRMAADLGVAATCNPMGAGKWPDEFAEIFKGARLVLVPDNDQAGRAHRDLVASKLKSTAKEILTFELPGVPEKGDFSDWADAGGTPEQFAELVAAAQPWQSAPFQSRYGAVKWENLDDPAPEHEWLIDDLLSRHDRSIIAGPSRSGKSFLAIHSAMAVARGVPFFGRKARQGLVVYQAGEGARGVRKRLRAYRQHHGLSLRDRLPIVLLTSRVDLYNADGDTGPLCEEIKALAQLYSVPLELVVIDTLSTATAGADENSAKDMSAALGNIARISESCGCHVMLVHHMNAGGTKVRGHTSIFANVDTVIEVTRADDGTRTARLTKQKDDEDGHLFKFVLKSIKLGERNDGKAITSCVIDSSEDSVAAAKEDAAGFSLKKAEEVFFRALMKAHADKGIPARADHVANHGAQYGQTMVPYTDWREAYQAVCDPGRDGEPPSPDACSKFFKYHYPTLQKFGIIGWSRPFVWWTGRPVRGFPQTFKKRRNSGEPTEAPAAIDGRNDGELPDNVIPINGRIDLE